ncbi:MAG: 1-acyl-sn-glycerol-3-phosphate acyltransferase [Oscillospiraceae bacterium]|nr:1-acyl-sn-glycerol-3-phosphate acyltransferase [Oscillospiraceae bacterium]
MSSSDNSNSIKRDKAIFTIASPVLHLIAKNKCEFTSKPLKPDEPFILVSNHLTESDLFIAYNVVHRHMYIVASEHLTRGNFLKKIELKLLHPVFRAKGMTDIGSVKEMLRRVRNGSSLLLFPEGHRSADGVTMPTTPALGKLIKQSKCTLITMKITGGYFAEPRWAKTVRKGKITAGVVGTYSPEELRSMSSEEVSKLVDRDIYEDAYERQRANPEKYTGERLAEGLENHLFICPECGGVSALHSEGNKLWCECGMQCEYDEYAFLHSTEQSYELPFDNVRDWTRWQKQQFEYKYILGDVKFTDDNVTLYKITPDHVRTEIESGTLVGDKEGLTIGGHHLLFSEMPSTAFMDRGNTLYFETPGNYWQLYGDGVCMLKYQLLWEKAKESAKS